jgi:hypothetical protein
MDRTTKPTWYSMTVSYDYFNPLRFFHSMTWKFTRVVIAFFLIPTVYKYLVGLHKRWERRIHQPYGTEKLELLPRL